MVSARASSYSPFPFLLVALLYRIFRLLGSSVRTLLQYSMALSNYLIIYLVTLRFRYAWDRFDQKLHFSCSDLSLVSNSMIASPLKYYLTALSDCFSLINEFPLSLASEAYCSLWVRFIHSEGDTSLPSDFTCTFTITSFPF